MDESHLLTLCVHPQARRRAYGRKMLTHLLAEADRLGADTCFLEVRPSNQAARSLYYSMGFVQVGERRQNALILSCRLDSRLQKQSEQ